MYIIMNVLEYIDMVINAIAFPFYLFIIYKVPLNYA